jgi:hypothetical protein
VNLWQIVLLIRQNNNLVVKFTDSKSMANCFTHQTMHISVVEFAASESWQIVLLTRQYNNLVVQFAASESMQIALLIRQYNSLVVQVVASESVAK